MESSVKLGRIFGIEIGLHYSWFLIALLIVLSLAGRFRATQPQWGEAVTWSTALITGALFFSALILHELSHALTARARGLPVGAITLFASSWADEEARRALLAVHGYARSTTYLQVFATTCDGPTGSDLGSGASLAEGFRLLESLTDEWVPERAECHRRAFDPSLMTPERYTDFRQAPGYDPTLDVAVVTDDDRVAAYAMAWADPASRTGQLEPVGTRPHFWRRPLVRAVEAAHIAA